MLSIIDKPFTRPYRLRYAWVKKYQCKKNTIGFVSDHWQEKDNTYNFVLLTLYTSNDNQNFPNIHNDILEHILQCEDQAVGRDQKKVLE